VQGKLKEKNMNKKGGARHRVTTIYEYRKKAGVANLKYGAPVLNTGEDNLFGTPE